MTEPSILEEISSLVGKKNITMPSVEAQGKGVSNPRMDPAVMSFIMQASIASQAVRIRKLVEEHIGKESFKGKMDVRSLIANDTTQSISPVDGWPNTAWIGAFIVNDGPDTVYIGINRASGWIKMLLGETRTIGYSHADERIEEVYYRTDPGNSAIVRVEGVY